MTTLKNKNILLCDIGGTHARFAVHKTQGEYADFQKYKMSEYESLESIVLAYCDHVEKQFDEAHFALARTPKNGLITYKRFAGDPDFTMDFNVIKDTLSCAVLNTYNDLEAGAYGVDLLSDVDVQNYISSQSKPSNTNKILISVGTGVGHALIADSIIYPTSGGHMLPVTVTEEHREIESFIRERKDKNLSLIMEDFVSARGLRMITSYVSGEDCDALDNEAFYSVLLKHPDAVRLFFEFLGLHTHNLVKVTGFYGGVYLAGGVIDYLIQYKAVDWQAFEQYFRSPMLPTVNERLGSVSVSHVLHDEMPLLGLTRIVDHYG